MRRRILAAVAAAAVATVVVPAIPAGAMCVGPTVRHDTGTVGRDETVRVVGMHWGDACNDTGGAGPVLGDPATGIEVLMVQGDLEHLVATGDADDDYGFVVEVPVPDALEPGPVEVIARAIDAAGEEVVVRADGLTGMDDETPEELVVSERPPIAGGDDAPATLGPWGGGSTLDEPGADDGDGPPVLVYGGGAVLLAGGLVAIVVARRRRALGR